MTKADLKRAEGVGISNLAVKLDLASLKAKVDKLDINRLKILPIDLYKLSTIVDNGIIKKHCLINWSQ